MSAAIDALIQSSLKKLEWIPCSQITDIEPTPTDAIYYASRKQPDGKVEETMLTLLGSNKECTPSVVSEFARTYSLPTQKYNNDVYQFRRYPEWLKQRNSLIIGFTKYEDKDRNKIVKIFTKSNSEYYMVANRKFYYCYSRYGICSACGILRCSSVWCICGRKELLNGWTSKNKQVDEFIKKSQLQTNSANDAYLEWISLNRTGDGDYAYLNGLPTYAPVKLIPLEITDGTDNFYFDKVTIKC